MGIALKVFLALVVVFIFVALVEGYRDRNKKKKNPYY